MKKLNILLTAFFIFLLIPYGVQAQASTEKVADFEFTDFSGKTRNFSEFKGKVVLLDFWATWCKPCLADIPTLKTAYEKFHSKGFEIIGMDSETLTGDADETPDPEFEAQSFANAQRVIKTRGVSWTQVNSKSAVPIARKTFNVSQLPTKILIDADGKIVARLKEGDDLNAAIERMFTDQPK